MLAQFAAAAVVAAVGWLPTSRMAPDGGLAAMAAGIGVSLSASIAAALPIALLRTPSPAGRQAAVLSAIAVRMIGTLALLGAVLATGWVPRVPLALWTAISYMALLAVETGGFLRIMRTRERETT